MHLDLLTRFDAEAAEMVRQAQAAREGLAPRPSAEADALLSVLRHAKGLRAALATLRQELINGGAGRAGAVNSK